MSIRQRIHLLRRDKAILFSSVLLLVFVFAGARYMLLESPEVTDAALHEPEVTDFIPALTVDPEQHGLEELHGVISPQQPFVTALLSADIPHNLADTIRRHLEAVAFNFRHCLPGQRFAAQIDTAGDLHVFRYELDRLRSYWVFREQGGELSARVWQTPVETELQSIEGQVVTSVYNTLVGMGEKVQLVADIVDILGYDIDFIFDPRVGDSFRILVEKKMLDGEFICYGRILAASYDGELTGSVRGYWFEADSSEQGYFAPDGENLRKAFMRSPLSILRVTSGFGMRTHPISGQRKMHTGIDYAAPTGTPVWTVGSGTVIFTGWKGGYGKTVEIKHPGGVVTRYGHLSRINVRKGQGVRQRQTIGAVGSTGYSTGPHLHFEYLVNGVFTQPRKIKNPSLKRLSAQHMDAYEAHMKSVDSLWTVVPRVRDTRSRFRVVASASSLAARPASS